MLLPILLPLLLSTHIHAWTTYTVPHSTGSDDTPALLSALQDTTYTSDVTILFAPNTTYNVWSPIVFPVFTNVEVRIEGNLSYPTNMTTVQSKISFMGGNNVTLRGNTDPDWGWVDGHGQQWWNIMEQAGRPYGWLFGNITNGVIRDMKIYKPIAWNFLTTGSSYLHVFNNIILAGSDNASFPFNTDGFSAGGTDMLFERNHVHNGDDCITVINGAKNITFRDSYCEGSHGLSVGSLGKAGQDSQVSDLLFENVIMNHTLYGARFKSWTGGNGLAQNATWRNIMFIDVMFPIYVTQNYWDQNVGPKPNSTNTNETHIENFLFENFVGVINDTPGYVEGSCISDPCWYAVTNATGKEVVIFDLYPDTATNIVAKDIFARTLTGAPVAAMCNTSTISTDVGFVCE
ncbi:glycoside hydrolase family 28 protein, partial [Serpula lacrymans var. lacrymans S7.9]